MLAGFGLPHPGIDAKAEGKGTEFKK